MIIMSQNKKDFMKAERINLSPSGLSVCINGYVYRNL